MLELFLLGESGQIPASVFLIYIYIYIYIYAICHLNTLHHLPSRMAVKQTYTALCKLHDDVSVPWVTEAQEVIQWYSIEPGDQCPNAFKQY